MEEYEIIKKNKTEFQKLLNQWKHLFTFEIMWMDYIGDEYHALIKRVRK